jgi:hypothetical protein
MAEFNFHKLVKDWHGQNISDDNINLSPIKLKALDVKWEHAGHDRVIVTPLTREVAITETNRHSASGALGQVHASKESDEGVTVTITSPLLKGLNRHFNLEVKKQEVVHNFGNHIGVDPSKVQTTKDNKMKLDMAIEQTLGPSGVAKAEISYKSNEYSATFSTTIELTGVVTIRAGAGAGAIQQKISEIIKDLKGQGRNDLRALTVNGDKVTLQMNGGVEFRWESDHKITWRQN